MSHFAPMHPVATPQPELGTLGDFFGSIDSLAVPDFNSMFASLEMDLPFGGPSSPTDQLQQYSSVPQMATPTKAPLMAATSAPISPADLYLDNESEIQRLLSGAQPTKPEQPTQPATTSTRSGRTVRSRNACIERVIDPNQEEDDVDLEVALSYGSRQGIAIDKPNKRRRRNDDDESSSSSSSPEVDRLEKNRQSARECRLRKKAYIRGLETQGRRLSDKVKQQEDEIASLRANLKAVYDKYQALAAKVATGAM